MLKQSFTLLALTAALASAQMATAATSQVISPEADGWIDTSAKTKLIRLSGGTLLSTYTYGNSRDNELVYDPKAQGERPARDIMVTVSNDDGANWSSPINISNLSLIHI